MSRDWYAHNPRDFIDGIIGLGPETIGAYITILDLIYLREGPIPNDGRWLSGVMGCSKRLADSLILKLVNAGKLTLIDGHLSNVRAEFELENSAKLMRKLSEAGANGGRTSAERKAKANKINEENQASLKQETGQDKTGQDITKTNPTDCQKAPSAKRGSRLTHDFEMPIDWLDWAVSDRRWRQADATEEAAAFVDYWRAKPGANGCKLDWQATWRNWCRNSRRQNNGQSTRKANPGDGLSQALARRVERLGLGRGVETTPN